MPVAFTENGKKQHRQFSCDSLLVHCVLLCMRGCRHEHCPPSTSTQVYPPISLQMLSGATCTQNHGENHLLFKKKTAMGSFKSSHSCDMTMHPLGSPIWHPLSRNLAALFAFSLSATRWMPKSEHICPSPRSHCWRTIDASASGIGSVICMALLDALPSSPPPARSQTWRS
jgi:hypothetical protein